MTADEQPWEPSPYEVRWFKAFDVASNPATVSQIAQDIREFRTKAVPSTPHIASMTGLAPNDEALRALATWIWCRDNERQAKELAPYWADMQAYLRWIEGL
jgi:hypothetical protein